MSDLDPSDHHCESLIGATPPDVLWSALFGFAPSDPMFHDQDGSDPARTVAKLLAVAGRDGFPVLGQSGEHCWRLPSHLNGPEVAEASAVLVRALDLMAADATALAHAAPSGRDTFEIAGQGRIVEVSDAALTDCLRTLLELPGWWEAPKATIVLANRPSDTQWCVAASGMDIDLLAWRAEKAVVESMATKYSDPLRLLDTPSGRAFQAALGPAPHGYATRIRAAADEPFFARSAGSWLAAAAVEAFDALPSARREPKRWQWTGTRRNALGAACLRLSGTGLGALTERVAICGPFEPTGMPTAMTFQRVSHGGVHAPLGAFMTAALAGETM